MKTIFLPPMTSIGNDIQRATELLESGQLVAIPTETVYGLAGHGLNRQALSRIFEVKNRPTFDPLILHTNSLEKLHGLVESIPSELKVLVNHFMPGPLTILLEKTSKIPDLVTAGSSKVAIRIPNHPIAQALLLNIDFPLAAPSANPFGYISPTNPQHVFDQLQGLIPYILDGGQSQVGLESTIIELHAKEGIRILRKGGLAVEEIEKIVGPVSIAPYSSSKPASPGRLETHYAPKTPLVLDSISNILTRYSARKIGVLSFTEFHPEIPIKQQLILSPEGSLSEAGQNFFSYLRLLDQMDVEIIVTHLLPDEGLGRAINDKLHRAAVK